jgi:isoleucyl-tRNA synthetase
MLSPIAPFLTESIYQNMFRNAEPARQKTVHALDWPVCTKKWIDNQLEAEMEAVKSVLSTVALARMQKGLKQRQPVPRIVVASDSKVTLRSLRTYAKLLNEQANTRTLIGTAQRNAAKYEAALGKGQFTKAEFAGGMVYIDLKLSKSELAEGLARDAVRRMQQMRKEMDLKVDSFVHAYVVAPSADTASLLQNKRKYMAQEVRAKRLTIGTKPLALSAPYYTKSWQIGQEKYEFGLCEVSRLREKPA